MVSPEATSGSSEQTLAAVEARYAVLLQELAQLFQLREYLRRGGTANDVPRDIAAPLPSTDAPAALPTLPLRPPLRLLHGGRSPETVALGATPQVEPRPKLTVIAGKAGTTASSTAS